MTAIAIVCSLACVICAALCMIGAHKVVKAFASFFDFQDSLKSSFSSFGSISPDIAVKSGKK